jgi:hypothetical protein
MSCEKNYCGAVSCKKDESRLIENCCKILWGYKRSKFEIMSLPHSLKFDIVFIIFFLIFDEYLKNSNLK